MTVTLRELLGEYAVARLESHLPIPRWADGEGFVSISRTDDELSVVGRRERVPHGVNFEDGWSCFKLQGPFAFGETGIILSVIEPLSSNGIGVFVVPTFDGDHLLVKTADAEMGLTLLRQAGHLLV
jgi:hypothetical protein